MNKVFLILALLGSSASLISHASTCADKTNSENTLREIVMMAPGTGVFLKHVENKDKSKACYEVGYMAGKVSAIEGFLSRCQDPQFKGKIAAGLQVCKSKIEKLKDACASDAPKSFSLNERLALNKNFWGEISSLMNSSSKCLEEEMWKTLPKGTSTPSGPTDGTTGAR